MSTKKTLTFVPLFGYRRPHKKPPIKTSSLKNSIFLDRFSLKISHNTQANYDSKGDRRWRGLQGLFLRRKKVRKRNRSSKESGESSGGFSPRWGGNRKAANKEAIQGAKKASCVPLTKGEGWMALSKKGRRCSKRWKIELGAIDGDSALSWKDWSYPVLQESKWTLGSNDRGKGFGVCKKPFGSANQRLVCFKEEEKSVKRRRRGRVYSSKGELKCAGSGAFLVMSSHFGWGQVLTSLIVYFNTIWDAIITHNHPSNSSFLKSECVYGYLPIISNCLVGYRACLQLSLSNCVRVMEMESKLVCDSEILFSNDMAIYSSSNHSGINTQGLNKVGKAVSAAEKQTPKPTSSLGGNQNFQVESIDIQLEKIKLESLEIKKSNSLMGFVCGNTTVFRKIKTKLLSAWRLTRGEVQIYERGHAWMV